MKAAGYKHQTELPADLALEVADAVYKLLEENQGRVGDRTQLITTDVHDFATKAKASADCAPASPAFVCSPHLSTADNILTITTKDLTTLSEEEKLNLAKSIHQYV